MSCTASELTEPKFPTWISKSVRIFAPRSLEIYGSVFTSLENLNIIAKCQIYLKEALIHYVSLYLAEQLEITITGYWQVNINSFQEIPRNSLRQFYGSGSEPDNICKTFFSNRLGMPIWNFSTIYIRYTWPLAFTMYSDCLCETLQGWLASKSFV